LPVGGTLMKRRHLEGEFNSQNVANTLWAFATMGRKQHMLYNKDYNRGVLYQQRGRERTLSPFLPVEVAVCRFSKRLHEVPVMK